MRCVDTMDADQVYQAYAPIYDHTGQERFGAYMARLTLGWLHTRGITPHRALDLACGAGGATLIYASAGIETIGLDRSPAMLQIARDRARAAGLDVTLIEADMRDLGRSRVYPVLSDESDNPGSYIIPDGCFDLVTCFGDSLNYLTDDGDLQCVFAGIRRVLAPAGYVIFDVNTETAFARWDERDLVVCDRDDCLVYNRLAYNPTTRIGQGRIVWFTRGDEGRWWRGEETHVERAWSDNDIRQALAACGLALVERLTVEGHSVADGAPLPERLVYIAAPDRL